MTESAVQLILGALGVNFVVLVGLFWKHGQWTGQVTTLLKAMQKTLADHQRRIGDTERGLAQLQGRLGNH